MMSKKNCNHIAVLVIVFLLCMSMMGAAFADAVPIKEIRHITNVYPFKDGYACARDINKVYHYFDANGKIVFSNHNPYYYMGAAVAIPAWPIDHGVTIAREADSDVYKLINMNKEVIREFPKSEYPWIGVSAGGYIGVEKAVNSLSGSSQNMIYYDVSGKELFSFQNMKHLKDGLSNFCAERAFVKNVDDEFVMIDTNGNQNVLRIDDLGVINSAMKQHIRDEEAEYQTQYVNCHFEIDKVEISSVNSFEEGEDYASACIWVEATISYDTDYGKREMYYGRNFAAAVSRDGTVKLLGPIKFNVVAPCKNNMILVRTSSEQFFGKCFNAWYVPSTGELIDAEKFPEFKDGKEQLVVYMEDGNLLVTMKNADGRAKFYAVVDRTGKVLSGPAEDQTGLPNEAIVYDQYSGGSDGATRFVLNLVNKDLIKKVKKNTYTVNKTEYFDISGQMIGNREYSIGTDFSNGYALVAVDSGKVDYTLVGEALKFINTSGEFVDAVVLPE